MKSPWNRSSFLKGVLRALRPLRPRYPKNLLRGYARFWKTYTEYRRLNGRTPCALADLELQIDDWQSITPLSYYFFQDTWAFHKIVHRKPALHVDIGSTALFVGCLAAVVKTISLDIRPVVASVPGLVSFSGSITQLPLRTSSIGSLSTLCVIEHIGLGRYGDPLDPNGTKKAANELTRVLAAGGDLYVSTPCGRSYVAFNAHRCFEKDEFVAMFNGLRLREFVLVNDSGIVDSFSPYPGVGLHVGLFHFTK